MNRMDRTFEEMRKQGEKILILYFPIEDPILGDSVEYAEKYFENGCTVLEIGLPYENPCLDGNTVKKSMERALSRADLDKVFDTIAAIRKRCPDKILQIMTYHGNCEKYGYAGFAKKCSDAGVDGVLCPDAKPEQWDRLDAALEFHGIRNLVFAPYHLTREKIEEVKKIKGGYVFLQAVDGGTGQQAEVSPHIRENAEILKKAGITAPICAGFGISNAEQLEEVLAFGVEGAIIGSATINHIQKGEGERFIAELSGKCKK